MHETSSMSRSEENTTFQYSDTNSWCAYIRLSTLLEQKTLDEEKGSLYNRISKPHCLYKK